MAGQLLAHTHRPSIESCCVRTISSVYVLYLVGSNGAHSCDDDEIAMAIISGYKSKREKDGEIREIGGKKKERRRRKLVRWPPLQKRDGTGETTLLCYPLWIGFSLPTNSRRLVWAVELVPSSEEEKQVRERAS